MIRCKNEYCALLAEKNPSSHAMLQQHLHYKSSYKLINLPAKTRLWSRSKLEFYSYRCSRKDRWASHFCCN